jgi:hypothetical protein
MNRLLWEPAILTYRNLKAKDQFLKPEKCLLLSQIDMKYCLALSDAGSDVVVLLAGPQGLSERTIKEGKTRE